MMTRRTALLMPFLGLGVAGCLYPKARLQSPDENDVAKAAEPRTIGDVSTVASIEPTPLVGVGLVVGLNGTGGPCPPNSWRTQLETELRKRKLPDIRETIDNPNHTLVIVSALIPPGARKHDPIDLEISLPEGSRCTSLKGGTLLECELKNFDSTKRLMPNSQGPERNLSGSVLARAEGPIVVESDGHRGPRTGAEEESQKVGRVWGGGRCLLDPPIFLTLNPDQQYSRVASQVADRINTAFPGAQHGTDAIAVAKNRSLVVLGVPVNYRQNVPHYLRVVRAVPLERTPPPDGPYRRRQADQLLDPARCMSAAIRLEALGEDSVQVLRAALSAPSPLSRFAAAQALAYLRKPACAEELARLAREQPMLRSYCLIALASLDESACHIRLAELMADKNPEVRYGAFRALRSLDERCPEVAGERLNMAFWLHQVVPDSEPMIHMLTARRPEIVLFGDKQLLVGPLRIAVGDEFTVTAERDAQVCKVKRFSVKNGPAEKQCSLNVADVLKALAEIGGGYADAVDLLKKANEGGRLSCDLKADALPRAADIQELAKIGKDDPTMRSALAATPALFRQGE